MSKLARKYCHVSIYTMVCLRLRRNRRPLALQFRSRNRRADGDSRIWARSCENVSYVNNKGADQPAHPRSLISTFVVRCLDSIIPILAKSKMSRL